MPANQTTIQLIKKCRLKLFDLAQNGGRMSYSDMRKYLGLSSRAQLARYLDPIYDCEVRCFGRPDITLILHRDGKKYGHFNSRGKLARSVRLTSNAVRTYGRDLRDVYTFWGGPLHGDVQALLSW